MIRRAVRLPTGNPWTAIASAAQLPRLTRSCAGDALAATKASFNEQKDQPSPKLEHDLSLRRRAQPKKRGQNQKNHKEPWHPIVHTPKPNPNAVKKLAFIPKRPEGPGGRLEFIGPNVDGNGVCRTVPAIWLRDSCQCMKCVHPVTRQREIDTFSIPSKIIIIKADVTDDEIRVLFSDGHESTFKPEALVARLSLDHEWSARQGDHDPILWGYEIKEKPPMVDYDKVMASDEGVKEWTYLIKRYGFCYVDGCPVSPEATQELLERISFIRYTHYGGFWDFTADMASNDTAYTNLGLDAHTDTTYFTDPARLQMFHLLSHEGGEGGASLLVDGFKVAMDLHKRNNAYYEVLSRFKSYGHASGNNGNSIFPLEPQPAFTHHGRQLVQIRWNNYDRDGLQPPVESWPHWYMGAKKWNQLLKSPVNEYWEQLKPGRPLIFDNWRVLHGRSAFTGQRRLCGGYINGDDFLARYRSLNFPNNGLMHWQM
ncbi:hypothetical protein IWX90DRAFT_441694 [Phyllosticta citrichinensis]|uniref:trimethyllysine dioxygenase n=1 Tax=Phyllosticta citrichinensis TaxID=1130410 RepID=A0ABR1XJB0_9PEZI